MAEIIPITGGAPSRGFVYILASAACPGLVKVGRTTGTPAGRAAQLDTTGVPLPFEVIAAFEVDDPDAAEKLVHRALASRRVRPNREWFYYTAAEAVSRVGAVLDVSPAAGRRRRWLRIVRGAVEALGWLLMVGMLISWAQP